MLLNVLLGFFGAFGVLCALWAIFGVWLPGSSRCSAAVQCPKGKEIAIIARFCRLRELGLTRADLIVLDTHLNSRQQRYIRSRYPYITFCTRQAFLAGQGREQASIEPGTGDFAGHHRGGGVSEL